MVIGGGVAGEPEAVLGAARTIEDRTAMAMEGMATTRRISMSGAGDLPLALVRLSACPLCCRI